MDICNLELSDFKNQYNFFQDYEKCNIERARNELQNYFENIDQQIFDAPWRKNKGYIPDGFKSRTLITIYGAITFKRRVYRYWDNVKGKYKSVFLLDKQLEIDKYARISNHLKFKIIEQIASGKRQQDICDMFYSANVTTTTIGKIIQSLEFQEPLKIIFDDVPQVKIPEHLYINMDETFLKLRVKGKMKKYRIRLVTYHTGYDKFWSTTKRKVLANKRVYWQLLPLNSKIDTAEFMKEVEKMANKFYSNVEDVETIIGGDGAPWIRKSTEYFPNSHYVLDNFHATRLLQRLFPTRKNELNEKQYQASKSLFDNGKYDELLENLRQATVKPEKIKKLSKIVRYFENNKDGVTNQSLSWNIGVSAEGDVSHIVKWLLGYGSKALNFKTFENMLLLRSAQMNGLDVVTYIKNEYQEERKKEKQYFRTSYWIKDKGKECEFPIQGTVPLLESSKQNSEWMHNMVHRDQF